MKKFYILCFAVLVTLNLSAQRISFSSNGHVNRFTKIDTMFLIEYTSHDTLLRPFGQDTSVHAFHISLDNAWGVVSKNKLAGQKLINKTSPAFTTSFYAYSDGTLQAPTTTLFFKPANMASVNKDFANYGTIKEHPLIKGFYYLHLNTSTYNNGDKIFTLCDSLYKIGIASIIEPVFLKKFKINSEESNITNYKSGIFTDPVDPLFPYQWNIQNSGINGTAGADMSVTASWALGYTGTGIKVAVIDCGVDLNHPDLQVNLLTGYDAQGRTNPGTAGSPGIYDSYNTHGTSCAGIIAEVKNSIGAVGIAYSSKIMPVLLGVTSSDHTIDATDADAANALLIAANHGADIISCSWGGGSQSSQIDNAISYAVSSGRGGKGCVVLFATGNDNSQTINYPASNPNVIAVGATSPCDTRKSPTSCDPETFWGGNYGLGLDVAAPGVLIPTTTFTSFTSHTYTQYFNGTSAATPNAAAVVALILSANPNLSGTKARTTLETTCDKIGGYSYSNNVLGQPNGRWSNEVGYGRINAFGAVMKAKGYDTIMGPDNVCGNGSATYTFPHLPSGATILWSSDYGTLAQSGNDATITIGNTIAVINLTATINLNGEKFSITRRVTGGNAFEGTYQSDDGTYHNVQVSPPNFFAPSDYVDIDFVWHGVTNITGTIDQTTVSFGVTNNRIYATMPSATSPIYSFTITLHGTSECGTAVDLPIQFVKSSCCGFALQNNYLLSPNPTSNLLKIQPTPPDLSVNNRSTNLERPGISEVNIYNQTGQLKYHQIFNGKTHNVQLDVSMLPTGLYYVQITSGSQKEKQLLKISK